MVFFFFFFQAEDGIRDRTVTGVQTCALPIFARRGRRRQRDSRRCSMKLALGAMLVTLVAASSADAQRSEERRVGKECRSRWSRYDYKKKIKMRSRERRTHSEKHETDESWSRV